MEESGIAFQRNKWGNNITYELKLYPCEGKNAYVVFSDKTIARLSIPSSGNITIQRYVSPMSSIDGLNYIAQTTEQTRIKEANSKNIFMVGKMARLHCWHTYASKK